MPTALPQAWHGAASWSDASPGEQPWRVKPDLVNMIMEETMVERAQVPNGVRLTVDTDASILECTLASRPAGVVAHADVVVDGMLAQTVRIEELTTFRVALPGTAARVELWLPHSAPTSVLDILLHDSNYLRAAPVQKTRWCTYGSSITQCNQAPSPTQTWPALVAAENSWDLTALGMAGQCHLDPPLAQTCGEANPDLISLCVGANIYGGSTFNARSLPATIIGFVSHIRRLTDAPIVVMSPIASRPERENTPNAVGLSQRDIRDIVHQSVERMQPNDPRLSLIDGTTVISEQEQHLLGDGLHPTPEGYRTMAERLAPRLADVSAAP